MANHKPASPPDLHDEHLPPCALDCPACAKAKVRGRLAVTGRVRRCEIENFVVIGREDGTPPVGYIADSLDAVNFVRASNDSAELLAALKGVLEIYGPMQGTLAGYIPHVRQAWERVEAAIAKAEGR